MVEIINVREKFNDEIIPVSTYALNKLLTIAEIMEHCEFRTVSITKPDDSQRIIRDFYIPEQKVAESELELDGLVRAIEHLNLQELGNLIIGIAHGHGGHGLFHSVPDNGAIDRLLSTCSGNNRTSQKLEFDFSSIRGSKTDGRYTLKAFNEIEAQLRFSAEQFSTDEAKKIKAHLGANLTKMTRHEVSSIIVNKNARDIYGLKRIEETVLMANLEEALRYLKLYRKFEEDQGKYQFDRINKQTVRYNIETIVGEVDIGDKRKIDKDQLFEELKSKLTFGTNDKPSSFRHGKVVAVPGLKEEELKVIELVADALADYISKGKDYSLWMRKNLMDMKIKSKKSRWVTFSENMTRPKIYPNRNGSVIDDIYRQTIVECIGRDIANNNHEIGEFVFALYKKLDKDKVKEKKKKSVFIRAEKIILNKASEKNTEYIEESLVSLANKLLGEPVIEKPKEIETAPEPKADEKIVEKKVYVPEFYVAPGLGKRRIIIPDLGEFFNEEQIVERCKYISDTSQNYFEMKASYSLVDKAIGYLRENYPDENHIGQIVNELTSMQELNSDALELFQQSMEKEIGGRWKAAKERYDNLTQEQVLDKGYFNSLYTNLLNVEQGLKALGYEEHSASVQVTIQKLVARRGDALKLGGSTRRVDS